MTYTMRRMLAAFRRDHMLRFKTEEEEIWAQIAGNLARISYWKYQNKTKPAIQRAMFIRSYTGHISNLLEHLKK
jgi:hypothetical protein